MSLRFQSLLLNSLLATIAVVVAAPLAWMLSASFMPAGAAQTSPPTLLPEAFTLNHYRDLFSRLHVSRYLINSLVIATSVTFLALILNSLAGYAFAKLQFRGRERLFQVLLAALVIPAQVAMLPLFMLLKQLGLINSYWAVILPASATIYGIFLVRQFATSIPDSLLDAARIDGAGELRIFFSMVLPWLRPVLLTLGLFTFLAMWNDFMWPLIVLSDKQNYTLPVALAILSGEHVQDSELMMAGAVLTTLPVLLIFLLLQKYFIGGIMLGSVKG